MSKALGQENVNKFEMWSDSIKQNDWSLFKKYEYRGELSKTKVARDCAVDLKAFKPGGNNALIAAFKRLDGELQNKFSNVFKRKGSSKDRYVAFVADLERKGGKFPANADGDLNYKAIAKKCNITTAALTSASISALLKADVLRIGTEVVAGRSVEERMDGHLQSTSAGLNRCRKDLAVAQEQIEGLKKQALKLERENRQVKLQSTEQQESLAHIIETGRRFTL
jgi:hypothetical protein